MIASIQWCEWEPEEPSHSAAVSKKQRRQSGVCGPPPESTIDGFPAVACDDPDFDDVLDGLIGYFDDCDDGDFEACMQKFSPGFKGGNYTDVDPDEPEIHELEERAVILRRREIVRRELVRRRLERRGFFDTLEKLISGGFKELGGALSGNKKLKDEGAASIRSGLSDIKVCRSPHVI